MSLSRKEIIIENIKKCSADTCMCSAEIDLLISDLIFDADLSHKSFFDIKNEIQQKFEDLTQKTNVSKYDLIGYKLHVCSALQRVKSNFNLPFLKSEKLNKAKIAYWQANNYCKEAFDVFSGVFSNCGGIQVESFSAVCENILDNETFGVIPIINSSDGRLMSFYKLLDKYDLKISAAHDVETPNGDGFTKFALVGHKLIDAAPLSDKNIELSFSGDVFDLLYVAEKIGGTIKEITSVPSPYNKHRPINYITLCVENEKIYNLWLFLYVFGGDFDFTGIYTDL